MSNLIVEISWLHGFISQLSNKSLKRTNSYSFLSCQLSSPSLNVQTVLEAFDTLVDQLRSQIRECTAGVHLKHL